MLRNRAWRFLRIYFYFASRDGQRNADCLALRHANESPERREVFQIVSV